MPLFNQGHLFKSIFWELILSEYITIEYPFYYNALKGF